MSFQLCVPSNDPHKSINEIVCPFAHVTGMGSSNGKPMWKLCVPWATFLWSSRGPGAHTFFPQPVEKVLVPIFALLRITYTSAWS